MEKWEKWRLEQLRNADVVETPGGIISTMEIPSWFDQKKFKKAQELFRNYYAAVNLAHFCGLLMVLFCPKILKTLQSTGKSDTKFSLLHRYVMTIQHIQNWYEGDVWNIDDAAHKSLFVVRSLHAAARKKMAFLKDGHVYVSQWDMAIVQWAFVGPIILFRSRLGFHGCKEEDFEALTHFWRTICYLLGIQDKYNLCSGEYEQVHRLCLEILQKEYRKVIVGGYPDSITMAKSVMSAAGLVSWLMQWSLFHCYIHWLLGIPSSRTLNVLEWILYDVGRFVVLYIYQIEILRRFFNDRCRLKVKEAKQLDLELRSGKHYKYKDIRVIYSLT